MLVSYTPVQMVHIFRSIHSFVPSSIRRVCQGYKRCKKRLQRVGIEPTISPVERWNLTTKIASCTSQCLCLQDRSPRRSITEPSPQLMIALESCRVIKVGVVLHEQEGKVLFRLLCLLRPDNLNKLLVSLRYSSFLLWYVILYSQIDIRSISCLLPSFYHSVFLNAHYKSTMSKTKEASSIYGLDFKIFKVCRYSAFLITEMSIAILL